MSSLRTRGSLMLLLAACGAACGGSAPGAAPLATPPPAPRSPGPIAAPEAAAERADADIERKTAMGATVAVPRGWYFKADSTRYTFEEPDRQFAMTLVEVESNDTNVAITKAWESLGKKAPKIESTQSYKDVAGWDELVETGYETPPSEGRAIFVNARRKGTRAWVFLVDAKTALLGKRNAQLRQVLGGLKVPGVEDEDFSKRTPVALDSERAKSFEAFIESVRVKTRLPGAAVAVVQDGKIVFEKGFGTREQGKKDPVTARTKFMIGSVTKSLSALLIAKLVDEGKVKWDTPVKQLLPSFETGDPEFTSKLALWHTFCACTGMPRHDLEMVFEYATVKPESAFTYFATLKPTTGFGETFQYSNQMTALGGFLAARIAEPNMPLSAAYEKAMKTRLFVPMGMNDTTASFEEGRKGAAVPHGMSLAAAYGDPIPIAPERERFVVPSAPAGSVFSTAHDMARYALVELASGKTPEGKEVVSSASLLERRKPRVKASAKASYGLGIGIAQSSGLEMVTHDGGTFGFLSRFLLIPNKQLGLVVLTNANPNGSDFTNAVMRRLFELVFGAKERAAADLDDELTHSREDFDKQKRKLTEQEMPAELRAGLLGTWQADRIGKLDVLSDPKAPKSLRADAGEWSTRLGYRKDEDGLERVFFLEGPVAGLPLRVDGKELVVELGQEAYRLSKRP